MQNRVYDHAESRNQEELKLVNTLMEREPRQFATTFLKCVRDKYPDDRLERHWKKTTLTLRERLDGKDLGSFNEIIKATLRKLHLPLELKLVGGSDFQPPRMPKASLENLNANITGHYFYYLLGPNQFFKFLTCSKKLIALRDNLPITLNKRKQLLEIERFIFLAQEALQENSASLCGTQELSYAVKTGIIMLALAVGSVIGLGFSIDACKEDCKGVEH